MDSIALLLEKANMSGFGTIEFEAYWDLEDEAQIKLLEESLSPLIPSLCQDKAMILGRSFNRHHFSKGFLAEEIHVLEDQKRCIKHFISRHFITSYVLVEPTEEGWTVQIFSREYQRKFQVQEQRAA